MNRLYDFVYRGVLTQESLDKAGRRNSTRLGRDEIDRLTEALSFKFLDDDRLEQAKKMSIVYTAIHAFENSVRDFVASAMAEQFKEEWWNEVPKKVKDKSKKRMEDEAKLRWHGARGGSEIEYCDFGDLSAIIVVKWEVFEDVLVDREWVKSTLSVLERSRNVVMHGGMLDRQDIERIGVNIRDWVRQAG